MTKFDYIERCAEAVKSIDPTTLLGLEVGQLIGESTMSMYTLGELPVYGSGVHVGIKLPGLFPSYNNPRAAVEMAEISIMCDRAPALTRHFPLFMCGIEVEGRPRTHGILTEDASKGNSLPVSETSSNNPVFDELKRAFGDEDDIDVFYWQEAKRMCFDVNEEVRFLDCFGVLADRNNQEYNAATEIAWDTHEEIKIQLPPNSTLGASMIDKRKELESKYPHLFSK